MERELPPDWSCDGQTDLTELVEDEYIPGGMPADEAAREQRRQEFYDLLKGGPGDPGDGARPPR